MEQIRDSFEAKVDQVLMIHVDKTITSLRSLAYDACDYEYELDQQIEEVRGMMGESARNEREKMLKDLTNLIQKEEQERQAIQMEQKLKNAKDEQMKELREKDAEIAR